LNSHEIPTKHGLEKVWEAETTNKEATRHSGRGLGGSGRLGIVEKGIQCRTEAQSASYRSNGPIREQAPKWLNSGRFLSKVILEHTFWDKSQKCTKS